MKKVLVILVMVLLCSTSVMGQNTTNDNKDLKEKTQKQLEDIEKKYKSQFRYYTLDGMEVSNPEEYEGTGIHLISVRTLPDDTKKITIIKNEKNEETEQPISYLQTTRVKNLLNATQQTLNANC